MTKKIKVIKSLSPDFWYAGAIGQEFEVIGTDREYFLVKREYEGYWPIHGMDTEYVPEKQATNP